MSDEEIIEKLNKIVKEKETMYWFDEIKSALDLINRQQEEIERLKGYNENLQAANTALSNEIIEIKSEAVKEFAERLKEKAYPFPCAIGVENAVTIRDINDILKEMVGEYDI